MALPTDIGFRRRFYLFGRAAKRFVSFRFAIGRVWRNHRGGFFDDQLKFFHCFYRLVIHLFDFVPWLDASQFGYPATQNRGDYELVPPVGQPETLGKVWSKNLYFHPHVGVVGRASDKGCFGPTSHAYIYGHQTLVAVIFHRNERIRLGAGDHADKTLPGADRFAVELNDHVSSA